MHIVSLVSPSWATVRDSRNGTTLATFGLWQYCDQSTDKTSVNCRTISESQISTGMLHLLSMSGTPKSMQNFSS